MRQTNFVRSRLAEWLKARIRKGLYTGQRKDLCFECPIEDLSLRPIIFRRVHTEGYGDRLMDLEPGIHSPDETGHPAEDDRCAHQYKAQSNLCNDEAAGCAGADGSGGLVSLERRQEIKFPGSANRHQRRQYGCGRHEYRQIAEDAPIRTEARSKISLTRRQDVEDHQRHAISEPHAESSADANGN